MTDKVGEMKSDKDAAEDLNAPPGLHLPNQQERHDPGAQKRMPLNQTKGIQEEDQARIGPQGRFQFGSITDSVLNPMPPPVQRTTSSPPIFHEHQSKRPLQHHQPLEMRSHVSPIDGKRHQNAKHNQLHHQQIHHHDKQAHHIPKHQLPQPQHAMQFQDPAVAAAAAAAASGMGIGMMLPPQGPMIPSFSSVPVVNNISIAPNIPVSMSNPYGMPGPGPRISIERPKSRAIAIVNPETNKVVNVEAPKEDSKKSVDSQASTATNNKKQTVTTPALQKAAQLQEQATPQRQVMNSPQNPVSLGPAQIHGVAPVPVQVSQGGPVPVHAGPNSQRQFVANSRHGPGSPHQAPSIPYPVVGGVPPGSYFNPHIAPGAYFGPNVPPAPYFNQNINQGRGVAGLPPNVSHMNHRAPQGRIQNPHHQQHLHGQHTNTQPAPSSPRRPRSISTDSANEFPASPSSPRDKYTQRNVNEAMQLARDMSAAGRESARKSLSVSSQGSPSNSSVNSQDGLRSRSDSASAPTVEEVAAVAASDSPSLNSLVDATSIQKSRESAGNQAEASSTGDDAFSEKEGTFQNDSEAASVKKDVTIARPVEQVKVGEEGKDDESNHKNENAEILVEAVEEESANVQENVEKAVVASPKGENLEQMSRNEIKTVADVAEALESSDESNGHEATGNGKINLCEKKTLETPAEDEQDLKEHREKMSSIDNKSEFETKDVKEIDNNHSEEALHDGEDVDKVAATKLRVNVGSPAEVEEGEVTKEIETEEEDDHDGSTTYSRDYLMKFRDRCRNPPADLQPADCISFGDGYAAMGGSNGPGANRNGPPTPSGEDQWKRGGGGYNGSPRFNQAQAVRNMAPAAPQHMLHGGQRNMPPPSGPNFRNPADDRWGHKPLPPIQMQHGRIHPHQMMYQNLPALHKAEHKYVINAVDDEDEKKQRELKGILNKLTPQNFEKMLKQIQDVKIDNAYGLQGLIGQIFDKSLSEATFCELYANLCLHLSQQMPEFEMNDKKISFRRVLLNKCQEEFEKGDTAVRNAEAIEIPEYEELDDNKDKLDETNNHDSENGEKRKRKLTDLEVRRKVEEKEDQVRKAKRRMLGNIRLIGELYKKQILTERIMHECIKKLLGQIEDPDQEDIEALCKLMTTIGAQIDHEKARDYMEAYFRRMDLLSNNTKLPSRIRFMLQDVMDLRQNMWQTRRKAEGPKKIEEVHKEAMMEQVEKARGAGRDNRNIRRDFPRQLGPPGPPFGDRRGPMGPPPGLSGPPGPSGPMMHNYGGPSPRNAPGLNGPPPGLSRQPQGRFDESRGNMAAGPSSQSRNSMLRATGSRPVIKATSPVDKAGDDMQINDKDDVRDNSDKADERRQQLSRKSISIVSEFYASPDTKELETCIKELNIEEDGPVIVSTWFEDAFGRRGMDHWVKLEHILVHLCSIEPPLLSSNTVSAGVKDLLDLIEDLVEDHPKGPVLVGRTLSPLVGMGVLSLEKLGEMLLNSGFEPGSLVESNNIALNFLASCLQSMGNADSSSLVKSWKSSNLDLKNFICERKRSDPEVLQGIIEKHDLACLFPETQTRENLESFLSRDGDGMQPGKALDWCKSNLSADTLAQAEFTSTVMHCALRALLPDLSVDLLTNPIGKITDEDENSIGHLLRQTVGRSSVDAQVEATYRLQEFFYSSNCKKGLMTRLLMDLYDADILSEDAVLKWKDDLREDIPGKGQAILDSHKWFEWLENASEEEED